MNQGKMWRVVNPTVGVPLFLGGVVVASLVVHAALTIKTDWVGKFFQGNQKAVATVSVAAPAPAPAPTK